MGQCASHSNSRQGSWEAQQNQGSASVEKTASHDSDSESDSSIGQSASDSQQLCVAELVLQPDNLGVPTLVLSHTSCSLRKPPQKPDPARPGRLRVTWSATSVPPEQADSWQLGVQSLSPTCQQFLNVDTFEEYLQNLLSCASRQSAATAATSLTPLGHVLVALAGMLHVGQQGQQQTLSNQQPAQMTINTQWPANGSHIQASFSITPGQNRLRISHKVITPPAHIPQQPAQTSQNGSISKFSRLTVTPPVASPAANRRLMTSDSGASPRSGFGPSTPSSQNELRCMRMATEAPFSMTLIVLQDGCVAAQNSLSRKYFGSLPPGWRLPPSTSASALSSREGSGHGSAVPLVSKGVRVLLELLLLLEEPEGGIPATIDDILHQVSQGQLWSSVVQVPQELADVLQRLHEAGQPPDNPDLAPLPAPTSIFPLGKRVSTNFASLQRVHSRSVSERFPSVRSMLQGVSELEQDDMESSPFSAWQDKDEDDAAMEMNRTAEPQHSLPGIHTSMQEIPAMPLAGFGSVGGNGTTSQPGNSQHGGTRRLQTLLSLMSHRAGTNDMDALFPAARSTTCANFAPQLPDCAAAFQSHPSHQNPRLSGRPIRASFDVNCVEVHQRSSSEIGVPPRLRADCKASPSNACPALNSRTSAALDFVGSAQDLGPLSQVVRKGPDERRRSLTLTALQASSLHVPSFSGRRSCWPTTPDMPCTPSADDLPQSAPPDPPQLPEGWAQALTEVHEELMQGPKCWHELFIKIVNDPVTGRPALLIAQRNVDERVQLEVQLSELTEAQLDMLAQIFPRYVVESLGVDGTLSVTQLAQAARSHPCATLLFMDLVGFTTMSEALSAEDVITFINNMFSTFDLLVEKHGVHKIDMLGDAMMCATGVLAPDADGFNVVDTEQNAERHARRMFDFAQDMIRAANQMRLPGSQERIKIRVGIHSGPCVSGLIGLRLPKWTVFGDTVNTAARMEQTSVPGKVQVSAATRALLSSSEQLHPTGGVMCKGKGVMETFLWEPPQVWAGEPALPAMFFLPAIGPVSEKSQLQAIPEKDVSSTHATSMSKDDVTVSCATSAQDLVKVGSWRRTAPGQLLTSGGPKALMDLWGAAEEDGAPVSADHALVAMAPFLLQSRPSGQRLSMHGRASLTGVPGAVDRDFGMLARPESLGDTVSHGSISCVFGRADSNVFAKASDASTLLKVLKAVNRQTSKLPSSRPRAK